VGKATDSATLVAIIMLTILRTTSPVQGFEHHLEKLLVKVYR